MDRAYVVRMLDLISAYCVGYPFDKDKVVDEVMSLLEKEPTAPTDVDPA